jgi:glucose-1-phosphate cytidylyltransferase
MKVVLLCGGKGSRLGEVTDGRIPKPMVRIGGRPIIWHIMNSYARYGFSEFIICAGHLSEYIKEYFYHYQLYASDLNVKTENGTVKFIGKSSENWSVTISDTGSETMTAGRIVKIAKYLDSAEPFFLTYGDGLANINFLQLLDFHKSHGRMATITGVVPPGRFGELHLSGDKVVAMTEKPDQTDRYINGGFMILSRSFIDGYCVSDDCDQVMLERAPLERSALDGELMMYRHNGFWQCMDTARDWELLNRLAGQSVLPWI